MAEQFKPNSETSSETSREDHTGAIIVVGAGQGGGEVAAQLRANGFEGRLVVIGEEPEPPYQRPPLSKDFLSGAANFESLLVRAPEAYEKANIELMTGTTVTQIDRHARSVTLSDGAVISYHRLILATGGRPRRMQVPGVTLKNIFYLRTVADVEALRPAFVAGARLVIVGGGYIGLEVAAVAVKSGLDVTVLEGAPRVLARVTSPEMSAFYETTHRAEGVKIQTGVVVSGFAEGQVPGGVGCVECAEGPSVPADLVVIGIGLIPNTELAEAAGLVVSNGIVVDAAERTSDPHIYAIGDCAAHAHHAFLQTKVRLESVPNVLEQARIAAASICGKPAPAATAPWFWSDQYKLKLQMVGLSDGYESLAVRGDMASGSFITFYFRNHEVIAADAVNRMGEFMVAKRLVAARKVLPPAVLADESRPLKALLT